FPVLGKIKLVHFQEERELRLGGWYAPTENDELPSQIVKCAPEIVNELTEQNADTLEVRRVIEMDAPWMFGCYALCIGNQSMGFVPLHRTDKFCDVQSLFFS